MSNTVMSNTVMSKTIRQALVIVFTGLVLLAGGTVLAATSWNLKNEQIATFSGKVVDVLCELSGSCPADCGGGMRQLGVLKQDGSLVMVSKGGTFFAGAVLELLPYCGQTIEVDGLMINHPQAPLFFVQQLRTDANAEWIKANRFEEQWKIANPDLNPPWFINDPIIQQILVEDGILGVPGLEP